MQAWAYKFLLAELALFVVWLGAYVSFTLLFGGWVHCAACLVTKWCLDSMAAGSCYVTSLMCKTGREKGPNSAVSNSFNSCRMGE